MKASLDKRPMRVWPGVVIVVLQWAITFGSGKVAPGTMVQFFGMMIGPLLGALLLFVWWLFASRLSWPERLLSFVLPVAAFVAAFFIVDRSVPMSMFVYGVPILCLAFLLWVAITRDWRSQPRRLALVAVTLIAAGGWALLRSDGVDGDMGTQFAWRWGQSAEERFLASSAAAPADSTETEIESGAPWPGFRGPARDGVVHGVSIATDWRASPPEELWRRPVGPGWGSFAVAGGLLFTQEQRGESEVVAAYRADTGEPVWTHEDRARFWEAMAGAGPRATPTFRQGRLYTLGATGILSALDAATGESYWTRNIAEDSGAKIPEWGFSSSPLVTGGLVVVHTGAPDGRSILAYDAGSGEIRWQAPADGLSYSSAQLTTLDGVPQLVMVTSSGASGLDPATGEVLWSHEWTLAGGARVVQPAITADGNVLIGTGFGMGLRRVAVTHTAGGWQTAERWTSTAMKPYYNDLVLHEGHAYGFDGRILACVDLETGERVWKGGRYGNGQVVLLPEQDLLLVLSDRGDVALVTASPDGFEEIAKIPAIDGKTWNHPVIADGVLYVRNGEEMAAFRLPRAADTTARRL